MKRYTEKIRENEYATGNAIIKELKIDENNEDKDYILEQQKNIINTLDNKLGKIEDLFDSYSVEDLQELDKLLGMATAYEDYIKFLKHNNESLQNAVVRKQNRIDELTNVFWLIVNKKVSILYVSLSADYERYNEYIEEEENKLTKKEFDEVKNYYCDFIEESE